MQIPVELLTFVCATGTLAYLLLRKSSKPGRH
jgi:hypothetical protein